MKPRTANLESIRLKPRKVGFVVKHQHPEAADLAIELGKFVISKGCPVVFAEESASVASALLRGVSQPGETQTTVKAGRRHPVLVVPGKADLSSVVDLIVVLGGDGT